MPLRPIIVCVSLALLGCAARTAPVQEPTAPTPGSFEGEDASFAEEQALMAANLEHPPTPAPAPAAEGGPPASAAGDPNQAPCAGTRSARVERLKRTIADWLDANARLQKNADAIRARCKLTKSAGGAVRLEGGRIRAALANDVTCSSLPKGVTKDEAYMLLARAGEPGATAPTGPVLQPSDYGTVDATCEASDRAAGFDWQAVRWDDLSAFRAMQNHP